MSPNGFLLLRNLTDNGTTPEEVLTSFLVMDLTDFEFELKESKLERFYDENVDKVKGSLDRSMDFFLKPRDLQPVKTDLEAFYTLKSLIEKYTDFNITKREFGDNITHEEIRDLRPHDFEVELKVTLQCTFKIFMKLYSKVRNCPISEVLGYSQQ